MFIEKNEVKRIFSKKVVFCSKTGLDNSLSNLQRNVQNKYIFIIFRKTHQNAARYLRRKTPFAHDLKRLNI